MPMPMPQQPVNPQYMPAQRSMPHPNDAVLRRSRKPTDKNIPDGVEEVVIGEGVPQYKNLRDLEKRLDASIVRKRLDIQDSISKTVKKYRTMRIWISNTVENQPWQDAAGEPGNTPGSGRYKVKIEGRLLDGDNDESTPSDDSDEDEVKEEKGDEMEHDGEKPEDKKESSRPKQRFSQFFKTITVDFDKLSSVTPEEMRTVTWNKPQLPPNATASLPANADFDCLQFSRGSQDNLNVTVSLVRDETPERFKLSKELANVLDTEEETRSGIVLGIWDYIRAMGLQEDEEKRQVRCDDRLRAVCPPTPSCFYVSRTNKHRSSAATSCSSPKSPKASARTPPPWTPSNFPTPSASMKTTTKTPPQQSTTSKSQSKTPCAPKCSP